jgi:hypothetical protein
VYTVLVGGYETLLEQHFAAAADTDLVCFTDDPTLTSTSWQIRRLTPRFPLDPNRSSRRPKILAHDYLADYDESLYIDNNVLLLVDPDAVFDALLGDEPMAVLRHSFRGTLAGEFAAVVDQGKDAAWLCEEQRTHYERTHPELLSGPPYWGGLLLRRHHDPAVRGAMHLWWDHVLRYSRRDQLSLPVALAEAGLRPAVHELDNHISPFHEWPRGAAQRDPRKSAPLPPGPTERIARLEQDAAELTQRLHEADRALADVGAELAARTGELAQRRDEIAKLRRSTSWRVTRPLRAARDRLGAIRAARDRINARRAARRPDA